MMANVRSLAIVQGELLFCSPVPPRQWKIDFLLDNPNTLVLQGYSEGAL
jgi:hypothetical protein